MGGYAVATDELAAVAAMLTDAAADARHRLDALHARADAGLARWQGVAGADYRHGWAEWHAGAVALIDALHDTARAVAASGRDYAGTEESVRAAAAGSRA